MKKSKNKRTGILAVILVGLLILAYKTMFAPSNEELLVVDDLAVQRVETLLQEIERINFNTEIFSDKKFDSLKSIETSLISLPVGKKNPFSGSFGPN